MGGVSVLCFVCCLARVCVNYVNTYQHARASIDKPAIRPAMPHITQYSCSSARPGTLTFGGCQQIFHLLDDALDLLAGFVQHFLVLVEIVTELRTVQLAVLELQRLQAGGHHVGGAGAERRRRAGRLLDRWVAAGGAGTAARCRCR